MYNDNWSISLKKSLLDRDLLLDYLCLEKETLPVPMAQQTFPLKVTREFASRIKKGDPDDPLLKQILSITDEDILVNGYGCDPHQETQIMKIPGLMQKYPSRVLVTLTGACAIHCRYCFRRHFPYEQNTPGRSGWDNIVDYINQNPKINEVIYSGGDPLMLKDAVLSELTEKITAISHLKRLRFHTRLPIVLPQRICDDFFHWMNNVSLQKIVVVHVNHPNEIDDAVGEALKAMVENKITVLNQSVLLKGVNDSAEVLAALSEKLFQYGAMPYYINVLDKVQGAAHFDLDTAQALKIYKDLLTLLPGFLVPKIVREVSGELNKLPIA